MKIGKQSELTPFPIPKIAKSLAEKHDQIILILAPPRTASTSLARLFWEHDRVGYYCHEPFEVVFFDGNPPQFAMETLQAPLDLTQVFGFKKGSQLVIKEMTFQVGKFFPRLVSLATQPVIFLIRDPRLSLMSRIKKLSEKDESILFAHGETGWHDLRRQIQYCEDHGIPHLLLDSSSFRNHPKATLQRVLTQVDLSFRTSLLSWRKLKDVPLGGKWKARSHWYTKVMGSSGLLPATEVVPHVDDFPEYWRDHLRDCLHIYRDLLQKPHAIQVS